MANSVTLEVLQDGSRNYTLKVVGLLDTSDLSLVTIIDPATMFPMDLIKPSQVAIDRVIFTVEEGLELQLFWDATTPVPIIDYVKAGHGDYKNFGGLQNNAGAGKTGKVLLSTDGFVNGTRASFTLTLECRKQAVSASGAWGE